MLTRLFLAAYMLVSWSTGLHDTPRSRMDTWAGPMRDVGLCHWWELVHRGADLMDSSSLMIRVGWGRTHDWEARRYDVLCPAGSGLQHVALMGEATKETYARLEADRRERLIARIRSGRY